MKNLCVNLLSQSIQYTLLINVLMALNCSDLCSGTIPVGHWPQTCVISGISNVSQNLTSSNIFCGKIWTQDGRCMGARVEGGLIKKSW